MTEFGRGPLLSARQLDSDGLPHGDLPADRVPRLDARRRQMSARLETARLPTPWLGRMQTRAELYELLGYEPIQDDRHEEAQHE